MSGGIFMPKDKGEIVFSGKTMDSVAMRFAEIVARNYSKDLEYWKVTAVDDRYEFQLWEERIKKEVPEIKQQAYAKISSIMKSAGDDKRYFIKSKKHWYSKGIELIRITRECGFYDDLLTEDSNVRSTVFVNVEYLIDRHECTIKRIVHSTNHYC